MTERSQAANRFRIQRLMRWFRHEDYKTALLSRFYAVVIAVNALAAVIDASMGRTLNAAVEAAAIAMLLLGFWALLHKGRIRTAALWFLAVLSVMLFGLIALNHFATMSVVFVLLLPLTVLPFLRLRSVIFVEAAMIAVMALLLYAESRLNPSNPLVQNPHALFNLAYTAAVIFVFGLLYHFSIVRTFGELAAANRQKEMLLKEVHHRVKNNLNVIASMIGLQANALREDEREHLLKSKVRIESIAMVHEMLYRSKDLESVAFHAYMQRLIRLLLGMYGRDDVTVRVEGDARLTLDTMVQLGIVANELVTNSIKYAFGEKGGIITLSLSREDTALRFIYEDDGPGVADPEKMSDGPTLGTRLVRLAVRQLHGRLRIESDSGLRYIIEFEENA